MDRRSFLKGLAVTTGIPAALAGVVKAEREEGTVPCRSSAMFSYDARCNCKEQRMKFVNNKPLIACPHHPPYFLNDDGSFAEIEIHES